MRDLIVDGTLSRLRTSMILMIGIMLFGLVARVLIPVEANPSVVMPLFSVQMAHQGISPEDASKLLAEPLEVELKSVEGINEVRSYCMQGMATVLVEFNETTEMDVALQDVRAAVDRTKPLLPSTAEEPRIAEMGTSEFPALIVGLLSEDMTERAVTKLARNLRDELESIPSVIEARLNGAREEVLDVHIAPELLASHRVSLDELAAALSRNARFIPAGTLDSGEGRISVKVPGLFADAAEIMKFPVRATSDSVVTIADIAEVRRTFKDRQVYVRINGLPSVGLWVFSRADSNMIATVRAVKETIARWMQSAPPELKVIYTADQGPWAEQQVTELQGNILTATILVLVLVVASMGVRQGLVVGLGIPVSFLFSLTFLWLAGLSFNFMVIFGMLLSLGILIDGAIVVTEYADRKMAEGQPRLAAFALAAKRMFWPVTASVGTTLMAFLPLLFWPGVAGEFMRYLPITVFTVLLGSLLYALVFGPALGAVVGKPTKRDERSSRTLQTLESGDPRSLKGLTGWYARTIERTTKYSLVTAVVTVLAIGAIFVGYGSAKLGMVFFTLSDPQYLQAFVRARGNLTPEERLELLEEVENQIIQVPGLHSASSSTTMGEVSTGMSGMHGMPSDTIAMIMLEMSHESTRNVTGWEAVANIRNRTRDMPGVIVEVDILEEGPPTGKPIQIQLQSDVREALLPALRRIRTYIDEEVDGVLDVGDSSPLPGIEWEVVVDRAQAALYGADVLQVGMAIQLVTNGLRLGEYRPEDTDDAIDIQLRFPDDARTLETLDGLMIVTNRGLVPISSFVERRPAASVQTLMRANGKPIETLSANVAPGVLADQRVNQIKNWVESAGLDARVHVTFPGASQEQMDSIRFILVAFCFAMLGMFLLLITQFNSMYHAFLILQAVAMSTAGVLLGLLITQNPFSAILTGVGVVALAGVVVNTNIVLIDTFNQVRRAHPEMGYLDVIVRTCAQRLRPLLLTSITTVAGLLPLASNASIDLVNRTVIFGGAMASFWAQLAQAIVFGLSFATVLTLFVTPAMLAMPFQLKILKQRIVGRFAPGRQALSA